MLSYRITGVFLNIAAVFQLRITNVLLCPCEISKKRNIYFVTIFLLTVIFVWKNIREIAWQDVNKLIVTSKRLRTQYENLRSYSTLVKFILIYLLKILCVSIFYQNL